MERHKEFDSYQTFIYIKYAYAIQARIQRLKEVSQAD